MNAFRTLPVPIKNIGKQSLFVMKPYHPLSPLKVIKAFSDHEKPIDSVVLPKLNNTIELFVELDQGRMDLLTGA